MPYRFRRKESLAESLLRVAREEFEKAVTTADDKRSDPAERVHDARTSCKKLRGLLRLVKPQLGKDYRHENAFLRDAARSLAAARDAAVVLDLFDDIVGSISVDRTAAAMVRKRLRDLLEATAAQDSDEARLRRFSEMMREHLAQRADRVIDGTGFKIIKPGLEATYRQARTTMRAAFLSEKADDWHEWRKHAKYHWYHVRLLRDVWKPVMAARQSELKRLTDLLGEDHDLVVLGDQVVCLTTNGDDAGDFPHRLQQEIMRRREERESATRLLGLRLFTEKPQVFTRRIRAYWKVWQMSR